MCRRIGSSRGWPLLDLRSPCCVGPPDLPYHNFVKQPRMLILTVVSFNTRFSFWFSNGIGIIKVLTLIFISITGLVVLGGNVSRIPEPHANFVDSFEGRATPYGLTNALYRIIFSYA